jgi:hypothetical protein
MCLYPTLIKNPKYKANKKNGGIAPVPVDPRVIYVPIGCGNCMECRKKKAREWKTRLSEEARTNPNGRFVTLTFNTESLQELSKECIGEGYTLDNQIASLAVRRFTERWRKEHKKTIRHWFITELGQNNTEHIHLHGIIWHNEDLETTMNKIERIWKYGYVWKWKENRGRKINYFNERSANYMCKYVMKIDHKHREYKQIILCSKGIGSGYIKSNRVADNVYKDEETRDYIKTDNGSKNAMPIYYRNKIYDDEEREKLWLIKLDQMKRYVDGQEIDISNGLDEYFTIRQQARKKNNILGFRNYRDMERLRYEEECRKIIHDTRMIKAKDKIEKQINENINGIYMYINRRINKGLI